MLIGEAIMPIDIAHENHDNVTVTNQQQFHKLIAALI